MNEKELGAAPIVEHFRHSPHYPSIFFTALSTMKNTGLKAPCADAYAVLLYGVFCGDTVPRTAAINGCYR